MILDRKHIRKLIGLVLYLIVAGTGVLWIWTAVISPRLNTVNHCDSSDVSCNTHGNPPVTTTSPVGPVSPPQLETPQICAVKEAITAGAPLIRSYWKEQTNIDRLHETIESTSQAKQTLHITDFQQTLEVVTMNRDKTYQLLVIAFQLATRNCTSKQQTQALADFVKEANSNGQMAPLVKYAQAFVSEAQTYQQTGVIDERLLKDTLPENTQ